MNHPEAMKFAMRRLRDTRDRTYGGAVRALVELIHKPCDVDVAVNVVCAVWTLGLKQQVDMRAEAHTRYGVAQ